MSDEPDRSGAYVLSTTDLMVGILFVVLIIVFYFAYLNVQSSIELKDKAELARKWEEVGEDVKRLTKKNTDLSKENSRLSDALAEEKAKRQEAEKEMRQAKSEADKAKSERDEAANALANYRQLYAQISIAREELLEKISAEAQSRGFKVKIDAKRGIIRLPKDELFKTGEMKLSKRGLANIRIMTAVLKDVLPCYVEKENRDASIFQESCGDIKYKLEAVFLEGHADVQRVIPNERYKDNYELSAKRALSAFRLINADNYIGKMKNKKGEFLFGVSGYGETRPICKETTDGCYKLNRRIDLRFVMQVPERLDN